MAVIYLQDPVTGKSVLAESYVGEGGGWKICISGYSFIYGRLKDNPRAIVGMVFRDVNREKIEGKDIPRFVRVTQAAHRWIKAQKKTDLPFLEFVAVKWTQIDNQLDALEQIEAHRQKLEGDFQEQPSEADQGN